MLRIRISLDISELSLANRIRRLQSAAHYQYEDPTELLTVSLDPLIALVHRQLNQNMNGFVSVCHSNGVFLPI